MLQMGAIFNFLIFCLPGSVPFPAFFQQQRAEQQPPHDALRSTSTLVNVTTLAAHNSQPPQAQTHQHHTIEEPSAHFFQNE